MSETREQVFEDLLREWRASESQIIGEWGVNGSQDEKEADRVEESWRERYRTARLEPQTTLGAP